MVGKVFSKAVASASMPRPLVLLTLYQAEKDFHSDPHVGLPAGQIV